MDDYFANPRRKPDDNWIPRRTTTDYGAFIAEDGSPGPQGPQGASPITTPSSGLTNSSGQQGPQGPNGNQGAQGPNGNQGAQGHDGFQGAQGPNGNQGTQGDNGTQGPVGEQGPSGPMGPTGPKGSFVKTSLGVYEFACIEGTKSWFADVIGTGEQLRDKFAAAISEPIYRFPSSDGKHELVFGVRREFPDFDMPEKTEEQRLKSVAFWNQEYK